MSLNILLALFGIARALIMRHPKQGQIIDANKPLNITWDLTTLDDMFLSASVWLTVYYENLPDTFGQEITTVPIAMHHLLWNESLPYGYYNEITLKDVQGNFSTGNFTVTNGPTFTIPLITSTTNAVATTVDGQSETSTTTATATATATATLTQPPTPSVLASVTQDPSAPSASTSQPANSGLSNGSKAGIGVGVALSAVALAGGFGYFYVRRHRQNRDDVSHGYDGNYSAHDQTHEPKSVSPPTYNSGGHHSTYSEADSRPLSELHSNPIAHELAA